MQNTDTGRHTDFRRKVTPEIGVTIQNSQHLAHKSKHESKKASAEQKALDNYYNAAKIFVIRRGRTW